MENRQPRADYDQQALGSAGKDWITNTTARTGKKYGCLHAITECTFSTLTDQTCDTAMGGLVLAKGDKIFGDFSAVTLTSGTLIAYYR